MPNLQPYAGTLRGGQYAYTGFLGFVPQTVVFTALVNMSAFTYPLKTITFDTVTVGAYTAIKQDMTVLVYHQGTTTLKGRLRVAAGASSSTVLQVNEFAKGTLDLRDNDTLVVVSEYRIWDKLVEAAAAFRKDSRITFTNQTDDYKPVANGGGAWFGLCDDGQTYATIQFDWTTSFTTDPESAGTRTYALAASDATVTMGSLTSSTVTLRVPYGFRHLQLTVTDSTNGASAVKQIPVDVYHRTLRPPLAVQADTLTMDVQRGASLTFRLPKGSEATIANLPDGALVGYFEDERYGGTKVSYGSNAPTARSHIKFIGFLTRDSITLSPDEADVTFEAESPLAILEQTAALTQLMIRDSTPDNWQDLKGLTVNLALAYLWYWHASIATAFDFLWVSGTDLAYSRLAVEDTSSVAGQLRDIASSINVQLTCDRLGRLMLVRDPNYDSLASRAARTTTYALTTADVMEAGIEREHRRAVKFVRGEAITPGTSTAAQRPVFSNAPGNAPGEGTQSETFTRKIATQSEINRLTGEHLARLNGTFYDETTRAITLVPKGTRLRLPDGYDVFDPAYREFVTLALAATTNPRGVAFTADERWTVESVSVTYDPETGAKDVELTIDHETHGVPGVSHFPPPTPSFDLPPLDTTFPGFDLYIPPVDVTVIPPNVIPAKIFGVGRAEGDVFICTSIDLATGNGDWTRTGNGLTGAGQNIHALSDPYNYFRYFLLTETGLWRCDDAWNGAPTWDQVATNLEIFGNASSRGRQLQMSHNKQGWIAIMAGMAAIAVSFDYGTTWHRRRVDGLAYSTATVYNGVNQAYFADLALAGHNSSSVGWLWSFVSGIYGDGINYGRMFRSTDWGLTWTQAWVTGPGAFYRVHVPYSKPGGAPNLNDSSQIIWLLRPSDGAVYTAVAGVQQCWFVPLMDDGGLSYSMASLQSFTLDSTYGWAIHGYGASRAIHKTTTGFCSWVSTGHGAGREGTNVRGFSSNPDYAIYWYNQLGGSPGGLVITLDSFATSTLVSAQLIAAGITLADVVYSEFNLSDWIPTRG